MEIPLFIKEGLELESLGDFLKATQTMSNRTRIKFQVCWLQKLRVKLWLAEAGVRDNGKVLIEGYKVSIVHVSPRDLLYGL